MCEEPCEAPQEWDNTAGKCMCPEGIEPDVNNQCCKNNLLWSPTADEYLIVNTGCGGCPSGMKEANADNGYDGCCDEDHFYTGNGWPIGGGVFNINACGCYEGSRPSNHHTGCCWNADGTIEKYGISYKADAYYDDNGLTPLEGVVNAEECGCPSGFRERQKWVYEQHESITICCDDDYHAIPNGEGLFDNYDYLPREPYCCKDADDNWMTDTQYCCEEGAGGVWKDGVCCWEGMDGTTMDGHVNLACGCPYPNDSIYNGPEYTGANPEKKNDICCTDNGYGFDVGSGKYVLNYLICGCPEGYHEGDVAGVCCSDANNGKDIAGNDHFEACGCPTQGNEQGTYQNNVCCLNHLTWNGTAYEDLSYGCGCPNGYNMQASLDAVDEGGLACCSENKGRVVYYDGEWHELGFAPVACGCPLADCGFAYDGHQYCRNSDGAAMIEVTNEGNAYIAAPQPQLGDGRCPSFGGYEPVSNSNTELHCCYMKDNVPYSAAFPDGMGGKEVGPDCEGDDVVPNVYPWCCPSGTVYLEENSTCIDADDCTTVSADGAFCDTYCQSADASEECCSAQGGTYFTTDGDAGYCCNGTTDVVTNEISTMCCMYQASKGTADTLECCSDDVLGDVGATSGDQTIWAKNLHEQCCLWKGGTWTERESGAAICCTGGVENRPTRELKCCDTTSEHEQSLTWSDGATGTVCVDNGEIAYVSASVDCADSVRKYCFWSCKEDENFGVTKDGYGECCPSNKYPSEFTGSDGKQHIYCCVQNEHASPFIKNGDGWVRCCPDGKEASYNAGVDYALCCGTDEMSTVYYNTDGEKQAICCPNGQVADNYGTCCNSSDLRESMVREGTSSSPVQVCCSTIEGEETSENKYLFPSDTPKTCFWGCLEDCDCTSWCHVPWTYTNVCDVSTHQCTQRGSLQKENVAIQIDSFNKGKITTQIISAMFEEIRGELTQIAGSNVKIIFSTQYERGISEGLSNAFGFVSAGDKKRIFIDALSCDPSTEDGFYHCLAVIVHENVHRVDNITSPKTRDYQDFLTRIYGGCLTEVHATAEAMIKVKLPHVYNGVCYAEDPFGEVDPDGRCTAYKQDPHVTAYEVPYFTDSHWARFWYDLGKDVDDPAWSGGSSALRCFLEEDWLNSDYGKGYMTKYAKEYEIASVDKVKTMTEALRAKQGVPKPEDVENDIIDELGTLICNKYKNESTLCMSCADFVGNPSVRAAIMGQLKDDAVVYGYTHHNSNIATCQDGGDCTPAEESTHCVIDGDENGDCATPEEFMENISDIPVTEFYTI